LHRAQQADAVSGVLVFFNIALSGLGLALANAAKRIAA